jgi:hypothetical protein
MCGVQRISARCAQCTSGRAHRDSLARDTLIKTIGEGPHLHSGQLQPSKQHAYSPLKGVTLRHNAPLCIYIMRFCVFLYNMCSRPFFICAQNLAHRRNPFLDQINFFGRPPSAADCSKDHRPAALFIVFHNTLSLYLCDYVRCYVSNFFCLDTLRIFHLPLIDLLQTATHAHAYAHITRVR